MPIGAATPDECTIRHFRNRLTEAGLLDDLMTCFYRKLDELGYDDDEDWVADASVVACPKQHNTAAENAAIKAGKSAQKDTDARWTGKTTGKFAAEGMESHITKKKPKGRPMPEAVARANARRSSVRARVEHVFAHQKSGYGLFVRTISLAHAATKIQLANLAYNLERLVFDLSPIICSRIHSMLE